MTDLMKKLNLGMNKALFRARKNAPELALAGGIITFGATMYLVYRAARKTDSILEEHQEYVEKIEKAVEEHPECNDGSVYSNEDGERDRLITTTRTSVDLVKIYAPAVLMGAVSIGCFVTSYRIQKKRYVATVAAFNAVSGAYALYRKRVREEFGDQMDRHFRYGTKLEKVDVEYVDENGKTKKKKEEIEVVDKEETLSPDLYSRWFDESNKNWDRNSSFNIAFLNAKQAMANTIFHAKGHLFLNEVYDMLGYKPTSEGCVVGWIDDGTGDGFVDFGLTDPNNESARMFINRESDTVLLNFNIDGLVWEKI